MKKKLLAAILGTVMVLAMCACDSDNANTNEPQTSTEITQQAESVDDLAADIIAEVQDKTGEMYYNYTFNDTKDYLYVNFKADGAATLIAMGYTAKWHELTDALDGACSHMATWTDGRFKLVFQFVNDQNPSNILYTTVNGTKIYDAAED